MHTSSGPKTQVQDTSPRPNNAINCIFRAQEGSNSDRQHRTIFPSDTAIEHKINVAWYRHSDLVARHITLHLIGHGQSYSQVDAGHYAKFQINARHSDPLHGPYYRLPLVCDVVDKKSTTKTLLEHKMTKHIKKYLYGLSIEAEHLKSVKSTKSLKLW